MRKLFKIIFGVSLFFPLIVSASVLGTQQGGTGTSSPSGILYGANTTGPLQTLNIGSNLTLSGNTLSASGGGGGGSGGGTWATTTSSVVGHYINYPLNNTDIVTIGGNSTSSAPFIFDPNSFIGYFGASVGINTRSPAFNLEVNGTASTTNLYATNATSTNATSTTLYVSSLASSTAEHINLATIGSINATQATTTYLYVGTQASTTALNSNSATIASIITNGLMAYASSTFANFTGLNATTSNATTTNLYASGNVVANNFIDSSTGGSTCIGETNGLLQNSNCVASLASAGATLTISSPTGNVDASISLSHGNIWSAASTTFNGGLTILTATTTNATTTTLYVSSLASSTQSNINLADIGSVNAIQSTSTYLYVGTQASTTNLLSNSATIGQFVTNDLEAFASSTLANFTGLNATTSSATTTNLYVSGVASTTQLYSSGLIACNSATNALTYTLSTGRFGCNTITPGTGTVTSVATDGTLTGGTITTSGTLGLNLTAQNIWSGASTTFNGGLTALTATTTNATTSTLYISTQASSTALKSNSATIGQIVTNNIESFASSTFANFTGINATTTSATTTNLYVSGVASTSQLYSTGLITCNSATSALTYTGTTGAFGCHTISTGITQIIAGTGLTGGTITTSGTIALDLTAGNIWTAASSTYVGGLTIGTATTTNATTTNFYVSTLASTTQLNANLASIGSASSTQATSTYLYTSNNSFLATTGGKVGVGTSSPFAELSVLAPANIDPFMIGSSTVNYFGVLKSGAYVENESRLATSTAMNLDWLNTGPSVNIRIGTSATTITFVNATTSQFAGSTKFVQICNPGTTAGALTWAGMEVAGTAITQTTTANFCDFYSFRVVSATSSPAAYKVAEIGAIASFP